MTNARYDLFTPEARKDPHPIYAALRRSHPVCQVDPGGLWAVGRYHDVLFILKHPELFSSQGFRVTVLASWLEQNPIADSIIMMDPPVHTKMRALVNKAFTPGTVTRLRPRIHAIAEELSDALVCMGEADFIADFAVPLPARVICELLGLDPSLHAEFNRYCADFSLVSPVTPIELVPQIRATMAEFMGYLGEVIAARRRAPAEDLVTRLIQAEVDGQKLTEAEIMGFLAILLLAGFETTTNLLAKTMLGLIERPQDIARLRADLGLLDRFTDEALRYHSPGEMILRQTTAEVMIAGVMIPEGAFVAGLLASANRDERVYEDGDRFDMDREQAPLLSFGHGIHYCLGAALAREEMRIGLCALLRRFAGFERTGGEIAWNRTLTVRTPLALPMRFIDSPPAALRREGALGYLAA